MTNFSYFASWCFSVFVWTLLIFFLGNIGNHTVSFLPVFIIVSIVITILLAIIKIQDSVALKKSKMEAKERELWDKGMDRFRKIYWWIVGSSILFSFIVVFYTVFYEETPFSFILFVKFFSLSAPVFAIIFMFLYFFYKSIKHLFSWKKNKAAAKEQERWDKEKARSRELWEEELHREITREEALAKVRNTSMIEMYKTQVELMTRYKQEGANIDKDILAMREKLLVLEGQENKAMVQDLMETLDRI